MFLFNLPDGDDAATFARLARESAGLRDVAPFSSREFMQLKMALPLVLKAKAAMKFDILAKSTHADAILAAQGIKPKAPIGSRPAG